MDTDVHIYSEYRMGDEWHAHAAHTFKKDVDSEWPEVSLNPFEPFTDRDYYLFGLLAGVKKHTSVATPAKGFPEDTSEEVREVYESWGNDAHTPSYMTLQELKQKAVELLLLPDTGEREHLLAKLTIGIDSFGPDAVPEDHRLVYWFDN